jgi:lysophospholipase L1-like esterase
MRMIRTSSVIVAIATGITIATCTVPQRPSRGAPPVVVAKLTPLPDSARFATEINAFAHADSVTPPPPDPVLFVGSSSIRMWASLATDFPGVPVLNRGFGGSRMDDLLRYADRIVFRYHPRAIVLYEGDNDLQDGRPPARIAGDVAEFLQRVRVTLPLTRVVCLSVKPSPSRWNIVDRMRQTNALLEAIVSRDTMATYVDVFTPMLGADGRPRPELFLADSLHMTPAGYAIWRDAVAPALRRR